MGVLLVSVRSVFSGHCGCHRKRDRHVPMNCNFQRDGGEIFCAACGFRYSTAADPAKVKRTCRPKGEMPRLTEMTGNAVRSAIEFVATGAELVDDAEHERRLTICEICENKLPGRNRCTECGCNLRAKAMAKVFQCPIGKWNVA